MSIDMNAPERLGQRKLLYDATPGFLDKYVPWCVLLGFSLAGLFYFEGIGRVILVCILLPVLFFLRYKSSPPQGTVFPDKLFDCGDDLLIEHKGRRTRTPFSNIDDISCVFSEEEDRDSDSSLGYRLVATTTLCLRKPARFTEVKADRFFTKLQCKSYGAWQREHLSEHDYDQPGPQSLFVELQRRLDEQRNTQPIMRQPDNFPISAKRGEIG
jgi:hypothetical protein